MLQSRYMHNANFESGSIQILLKYLPKCISYKEIRSNLQCKKVLQIHCFENWDIMKDLFSSASKLDKYNCKVKLYFGF